MALPGEGSADIEALRKRIEYGLTLLGREGNAATRERMKVAIQADRERLRQLEEDQPQREPLHTTSQRPRAMSKSKIWDVIEKANQVPAEEPPRQEAPGHNRPQEERETPRKGKENAAATPRDEGEQQRRAQIIAELQRRRDVLMAQLHPQPATPKGTTPEETRRDEEAQARKKQEQAKLDLRTAVPRERSSGVSYSWVSPTVSSSGSEARDLPRPAKHPAPDTDRGSSGRSSSRRRRAPSEDRRSTRSVDSRASSQRSQNTTRGSRSDTSYPPRARANRPPAPQQQEDEQQQHRQLRRRDSEQGRESGSSRHADDKTRRREREREREGDRGGARHRSHSRDQDRDRDRRRRSEPPRGGLLEELLKLGPWRA